MGTDVHCEQREVTRRAPCGLDRLLISITTALRGSRHASMISDHEFERDRLEVAAFLQALTDARAQEALTGRATYEQFDLEDQVGIFEDFLREAVRRLGQ